MKKAMVGLAVVLIVLFFVIDGFAQEPIWNDVGRGNTDFRTVLINPDNPHFIYAGTANSIIKSEDGIDTWRVVLSIKGQNKEVNLLAFDQKDKNSIYAATGNGLFISCDKGNNWKRIFQGKNNFEKECVSLAILPSAIYLGTKAGLFISNDKGRSWHKETGKIGNSHILAIVSNVNEPDYIYVACIDGVFKTQDAGKSWERIFITHPVENGDDKDEANEDQDEEERFSDIRYISIDPNNSNYVYIATGKGIYKSRDKGKSWDLLTDYGLLSGDIKFLLMSLKSTVYAVTKSGVFEYRNERWHELSLGLTAEDIRFLAQDNQGNLYAACNNGLFKADLKYSVDDSKGNLIQSYSKDEPKIKEVQEAAIKYAEVEPEKIKQWRKQAAKKALLPQLSVGIDRNTTDLWHWEGGSTTRTDDDVLRRGRDSLDWDINLSWDLGELIWNNDQTSIDVRSRLMVQLRDDVLDEVTKLYFERIRVKMELDNLSIEDRKKRFEKELKIQELTAQLDGLTGGYFSKKNPNKNVGI